MLIGFFVQSKKLFQTPKKFKALVAQTDRDFFSLPTEPHESVRVEHLPRLLRKKKPNLDKLYTFPQILAPIAFWLDIDNELHRNVIYYLLETSIKQIRNQGDKKALGEFQNFIKTLIRSALLDQTVQQTIEQESKVRLSETDNDPVEENKSAAVFKAMNKLKKLFRYYAAEFIFGNQCPTLVKTLKPSQLNLLSNRKLFQHQEVAPEDKRSAPQRPEAKIPLGLTEFSKLVTPHESIDSKLSMDHRLWTLTSRKDGISSLHVVEAITHWRKKSDSDSLPGSLNRSDSADCRGHTLATKLNDGLKYKLHENNFKDLSTEEKKRVQDLFLDPRFSKVLNVSIPSEEWLQKVEKNGKDPYARKIIAAMSMRQEVDRQKLKFSERFWNWSERSRQQIKQRKFIENFLEQDTCTPTEAMMVAEMSSFELAKTSPEFAHCHLFAPAQTKLLKNTNFNVLANLILNSTSEEFRNSIAQCLIEQDTIPDKGIENALTLLEKCNHPALTTHLTKKLRTKILTEHPHPQALGQIIHWVSENFLKVESKHNKSKSQDFEIKKSSPPVPPRLKTQKTLQGTIPATRFNILLNICVCFEINDEAPEHPEEKSLSPNSKIALQFKEVVDIDPRIRDASIYICSKISTLEKMSSFQKLQTFYAALSCGLDRKPIEIENAQPLTPRRPEIPPKRKSEGGDGPLKTDAKLAELKEPNPVSSPPPIPKKPGARGRHSLNGEARQPATRTTSRSDPGSGVGIKNLSEAIRQTAGTSGNYGAVSQDQQTSPNAPKTPVKRLVN